MATEIDRLLDDPLQWRRQQGRDREGIEQDELVADLEAVAGGFEPVAVEAGGEQPGLAFLVGLIDRERASTASPSLSPGIRRGRPIRWRSVWMLYLLASRSAMMRSSSMARLSQKISAAGRSRSRFSRETTLYRHSAAKSASQASYLALVEQPAIFGEEIVNRRAVEAHRTAPAGSIPNSSA